ncbi:uncharacterized protein LTHEOB_5357 [Neofusicoccum parvum]|nr:uncharacterized protein LTHEOB_5357 [Neofusicoccum parvum]
MLLVHQAGSVKVGEVVRYTLTYTPANDRILPSPAQLHLKIKNSSAIPLRAAYLHGPYTLHVAAYPSSFNPNRKVENPKKEGVPDFEPNLKAGGSWATRLLVPEEIRESGGKTSVKRTADGEPKSVTWIIEIHSQILFSNSASVSFELLVGRDERSLDYGFAAVAGHGQGTPGQVEDHQQGKSRHEGRHPAQPKGVYSRAIRLVVDDTTSLWNKPALPEWDEADKPRTSRDGYEAHPKDANKVKRQKNIHVVIVTHGLHSNLGADMLYVKESIDAAAKQAREEAVKRRRAARRGESSEATVTPESQANGGNLKDSSTAPLSGGQEDLYGDDAEDDDPDDEEVIVRGFGGNAVRTERGIQYLGKRLAKYVLGLTYPDQPYLPIKKSMKNKMSNTFSSGKAPADEGIPAHSGSSVHHQRHPSKHEERAYKFTSISFVGHSLGGLVQTYAIAYIHKHSPEFFHKIKPVNFICMSSPMLGLSNENPMYVKFALDFGLVGRTGQDLGLTWRPPTIARGSWAAMVSGFGTAQKEQKAEDPGAKPLLRILPTGPAHQVLRMFRNRTVYSNVVNDGVVPLRTSCLLFLDWKGLGRVEKARRENGLVGTLASWGFAELTGQNSSPNPSRSGMRVEEKIARSYHKDLSWRKVLVRLEPDAHNNIVVRRMFANAYGWPVVKHLCDTHFADTYAARTRDEREPAVDRAAHASAANTSAGEEVEGQRAKSPPPRSPSEMREAADELAPLREDSIASDGTGTSNQHHDHLHSSHHGGKVLRREDSSLWDDTYFEGGTEDESDDVDDEETPDNRGYFQRFLSPAPQGKNRKIAPTSEPKPTSPGTGDLSQAGTSAADIESFLTAKAPPPEIVVEGHRGLSPTVVSPTEKTKKRDSLDKGKAAVTESSTPTPTAEDVPLPSPSETTIAPGGTAEVGLRKSVEEQIGSPTIERPGSSAGSVVEEVAKAFSGPAGPNDSSKQQQS